MRIWRSLHRMGWGILKDCVYLMPGRTARQDGFAEIESKANAVGGFAMTVEMNSNSAA